MDVITTDLKLFFLQTVHVHWGGRSSSIYTRIPPRAKPDHPLLLAGATTDQIFPVWIYPLGIATPHVLYVLATACNLL